MLDEDLSIGLCDADPTTAKGAPKLEGDTKQIALSDIAVPTDRMRSLQPEVVDKIAESIEKVGQLQSIVIRSAAGSADTAYYLVSGRHRLEAARKLGWGSIRALVVESFDADRAQLAEIDENLIRGELSPAETAAHQAARKAIYLRMNPETKAGGDRKSKSHGEILKEPTYIDAAAETGRSRATVARQVRRGENIPDVAAIAGTSLDKDGELDALAKLPADQQARLVAKAKAGKKVSAKPSKAVKAVREAKRKGKHEKEHEERQAQNRAQLEEDQSAGDERAHIAVAYLRQHLNAEQLVEFFTLVEQPNCRGYWNKFGEVLEREPEIKRLSRAHHILDGEPEPEPQTIDVQYCAPPKGWAETQERLRRLEAKGKVTRSVGEADQSIFRWS